jgi:hypothetical protein
VFFEELLNGSSKNLEVPQQFQFKEALKDTPGIFIVYIYNAFRKYSKPSLLPHFVSVIALF